MPARHRRGGDRRGLRERGRRGRAGGHRIGRFGRRCGLDHLGRGRRLGRRFAAQLLALVRRLRVGERDHQRCHRLGGGEGRPARAGVQHVSRPDASARRGHARAGHHDRALEQLHRERVRAPIPGRAEARPGHADLVVTRVDLPAGVGTVDDAGVEMAVVEDHRGAVGVDGIDVRVAAIADHDARAVGKDRRHRLTGGRYQQITGLAEATRCIDRERQESRSPVQRDRHQHHRRRRRRRRPERDPAPGPRLGARLRRHLVPPPDA